MNNKGQFTVGMFVLVAVSLIVGAILFQTIAQQVGTTTNTIAIENESLVTAASDGAEIYLTTWRAIGSVNVYNATGDVPVAEDNYTVTNNVIHPTTGDLTTLVTVTTISALNNGVWTIDGTGQPLTYVDDSGARTMISLIVLFFALVLLAVALYPVYQSKILDMLGK